MNEFNKRCSHEAKILGKKGEQAACALLLRLGYRLLDLNWRYQHLEIDIVCQDGNCIVFVEVKTRKSSAYGGPAGAVTRSKMRNLGRAALAWIKLHNAWDKPGRFDVICLTGTENNFALEHFINAFPFAHTLGRCHTPWQPW